MPPAGGLHYRGWIIGGIGGAKRDRTADLLHAMQALSQLSYGPIPKQGAKDVGPTFRECLAGILVFSEGLTRPSEAEPIG